MRSNQKLEKELKKNIKNLVEDSERVIRYGYRKAALVNTLVKYDREELEEIEKMLMKKSGETDCNNFVVYKLVFEQGGILFIECADLEIRIGVSITFDVIC